MRSGKIAADDSSELSEGMAAPRKRGRRMADIEASDNEELSADDMQLMAENLGEAIP